jgi:ABC-2 type transport system permease protein
MLGRGICVEDFEAHIGEIRAACYARVGRNTRWSQLVAKAGMFTAVAFTATLASSFAAFFLGQAIFTTTGIEAHLDDPGALRSVFGAALYLAACWPSPLAR